MTLRRLTIPLSAVIVAIWLAIGGFGGPTIGKLASVASNNSADYLPASSQAAQVQTELASFQPEGAKPTLPAIVVATRDSGITHADKQYLYEEISQFLASSQPASHGKPSSQMSKDALTVSDDHLAVQTAVPVPANDGAQLQVSALRDALAHPPGGLTVLVTGPAGQIADMVSAFGGIDGILLLVAGGVVALILLLVYRGPLVVLIVLASAVFALSLAALIVYGLATSGAITLSGMSQGILFILVFGAATDYALLLVSRYRQQLRDHQDPTLAMKTAWRATFAPVTASASTVIIGLLCLLFSDLKSTSDLGPIATIGIVAAYLASMTFLPAALLLCRRATFWPLVPHAGSEHPETGGLWGAIASLVKRHYRRVWVITAVVLIACVAFVPGLKAHGTSQSDVFLTKVDSVVGQDLLDEHFPGGTGSPTWIVTNADTQSQVHQAVATVSGVDSVTDIPGTADGNRVRMQAVLDASASSQTALDTVQHIRGAVNPIRGADAQVGGQDALQLDTNLTSERDRTVIIPIVLVVVFLVLALLLRALIAPLVLIATVVLSYVATLGVAALVFNHLFHFPGADPAVPLFAFVFLVALGVDYNIFLMTRVREETHHHGTRRGTTRGLALTGGVITSAGVVLAATFAALSVLPILFLAEIAFLVAFGVLLDTIVVRSLLVPALTLEIGRSMWWPSALRHRRDDNADQASANPS